MKDGISPQSMLHREAAINSGRFIINELTENEEYNTLLKSVNGADPLLTSVRTQIKEAFRFNDSHMISEIRAFIKSNFPVVKQYENAIVDN